ncbi:tyrosine-protein kinase BAZ1B isoform X1 [Manis pentadactyla]|uniref:tyrosine-protein kinase BAZ1B isoform X1 n=2 Tax=Manis pentadactyla TaxID=143292 RepID=UPI00255C8A09|nr:tyrosine-protein kinase BAZ1B isoform X1 [Manis pentadactyla]KAI5139972.1 Tyrosine-Protein Kinase Baz1B [Manis pentadactyla]
MAPLLGRKPFPLVKPLPGEEPLFTIAHTQEAFRTREEYEARLERYSERIWTCKSTGSSQLTHKEAWEEEQEVAELLKEEFPAWYEKLVLEMVHHNTASLEKLVDTAWLEIMTKYAVGEDCDFEVGKEKMLKVRIVKIHPLEKVDEEAAEKKSNGACDSPSSDKENSSQITQDHQKKEAVVKDDEGRRESINDRARRSPRKLPTSLKKGERKWAPPKFLPHKYDVKLQNEDKIISNVPADSLIRTERPPNKEILRYFIRHNAIRAGTGENAPWVVEDELVKKYSLPSKFSDFLLDPYKYLTLNPSTKRKNTGSPDRKPSKKSKTDNSSLSSPLNPKLWCHVHLKKSLNDSPLKVKNSKNSKSPEEHLEEVMKMMSPTKLHANFHIPKKGPSVKKSGKHSDKPLKAKGRSKGILNGQKSAGNSKSPKKGLKTPKTKMKQMTLLDMAKGTQKMTRAPRNSGGTPRSSSKPHKHLPPAALHLIAYYKENKDREDKKSALSCVISKTARLLSSEDRARLPEELRGLVQKRFELLEHKKRWASMSEEQRKEYLKKKREELKEKLKEKAKERREKEMLEKLEKQKRYEDQELNGKNLPAFRLMDTPEGLPNTLFGDVALVVEFLSCYSGLLLPDAQYPITAVSLMEALSAEKGGFLYLNRVLVILLQTLLQDEIAEDYGELGMKLSEIPLTLHSVSELVRLCLRKSDVQEESEGSDTDDNKDSAPFEDNEVQDEFLERLETSEFFELTSEEKLQILTALCHRILMTYSVQDHMETRQQMSAELWKERLAVLKEENDKKRAEKQKRKEMEARNKENGKEENGLGKTDRKKEVKFEPQVDMEAEDMISAVKSRRLLAIQAKKEREIQEREMKVKLEREAEEERIRRHKAAAEKAFQEGIAKAKLVMRRTPIGTDRNHNRYWLFSDEVPGLFIEKGWVHDSIDYRFNHHWKDQADSADEDYCPRSKKANLGKNVSMNPQPGPEISVETTIPKQGQNLWFLCDSQKELDELLNCLHPQGIRESQLKERLEKRYQDIIHSIHLARKPNLGLKSCDGSQELLNFLRSDLIEVATRLQKGGLGYVEETSEFEARVISLVKLKDFGECVIALQASVIKKFLQGFMAPKQKRRKLQSEDSVKTEEVDEEKKMAEEAKVASALEKWKTAIREAQTFSRMHVLLGMLDACIKWDMSAENARCKVCRKKGEDDKLILCDECNKAFHLFCLRPALYEVPDGEWQCPACQPATARRNSRGRNYTEESASEDSEDDETDEEEDEEEEEEEEEDYEVAGLRLRPRKTVRGKQGVIPAVVRPGRRPGKNPHPTRKSQLKAPPMDDTEVDELVLQTKRSSRRQSLELQKCEEILHKIVKYRFSWPFREPVTRDEAEDYYEVITHPMDFQTVQNKCSCGSYRSVQEFLTDIKQVFTNAELYNCRGSHVLNCMVKTEQCLVALLHKHLPGHPYVRRKRKKFPDRLAEDEGDSELEPVGQPRGRRQKK